MTCKHGLPLCWCHECNPPRVPSSSALALQERTTALVREELRRLLWVENAAHLERVDYCWKHNVPDEVMESIRVEVRAAQREARMKARGGVPT